MPKRTDIQSILIIGAGPIIIGQACEFDYSGSQACKALREEGYRVILVNSNPATIMTDPDMADVTYVEPLTPETVEKIIARERPDALLPTLGGQTALNLSLRLAQSGVLAKYGVELIGAKADAIERGEDRQKFRQIMLDIGLDIPKSKVVKSIDEARACVDEVGGAFPLIIRPSFTLGGTGGGIAYNREEYERMVVFGLDCSPVHEVLVEECLLGWKEYEMEVMRDHKDQCVIICSIENFDPMGVHTGDSITIAPALTLSDKEYQLMRDASFAIIRAIGVETGGSNIQFAVNPSNGRLIVIEMNPRVSRSSALASKATGFPIAKIAAKLAVGYALDELRNDITRSTPASFEPAIDYIVTKVPRFAFEKFNGADRTLTSSMKAVGEVMAIGRTFQESFQKALRSLEIGAWGFGGGGKFGGAEVVDRDKIRAALVTPTAERVFYIRYAFQAGIGVDEIHALSKIDPWFLHQLRGIYDMETRLVAAGFDGLDAALLREAKAAGFTDRQLAQLTHVSPVRVREKRLAAGVRTVYRLVDTCAAEFEAKTPYYYSSHGDENEIMPSEPVAASSAGDTANWPPLDTPNAPVETTVFTTSEAKLPAHTDKNVDALEWALNNLRSTYPNQNTQWQIGVHALGLRHTFKFMRGNAEAFQIVEALPQIIARMVRLERDLAPDTNRDGVLKAHVFYAPLLVDNVPCIAKVMVHEMDPSISPSHQFYNLQSVEIEKALCGFRGSSENAESIHATQGFQSLTHARLLELVKTLFLKTSPNAASQRRAPSPAGRRPALPAPRPKIMILGGGPNRIGQGIEFDYCCVHASLALRAAGYETVMVNSNPETVSTDYDTSDRLYFEPLTLEDVLEIYHQENCAGAIVQFGGQTPLNLATDLEANGVKVIGTSPASINLAEDRQLFKDILDQLDIKQPQNRIALSPPQAYAMAAEIGFPILLRPSFVLGGRGMFIVYDMDELRSVVLEAFDVAPGKPVLLDKFLEDAIELDVDAISDGDTTLIGGMLEHIEYAGVHSGDAAMVLPPHTLPPPIIAEVRRITHALARKLRVIGLMNIQFAIKDSTVYMLEVNPRASRTVPFVSKAIGVPLAKLAARCMVGEKLRDHGYTTEITAPYYAIKESVFPFNRFPGAPIALSPEMRSTGEVMGLDPDFGLAYAKSQMAAQPPLPPAGNVFFSVKDRDKPAAIEVAHALADLGFQIYSTAGTAEALAAAGIPVHHLHKITGGGRPNVLDMLKNGQMQIIINTPTGMMPRRDENMMRSEAVLRGVCMISTLMGARAAVQGIRALRDHPLTVTPLQTYREILKKHLGVDRLPE